MGCGRCDAEPAGLKPQCSIPPRPRHHPCEFRSAGAAVVADDRQVPVACGEVAGYRVDARPDPCRAGVRNAYEACRAAAAVVQGDGPKIRGVYATALLDVTTAYRGGSADLTRPAARLNGG